MDKIKNIVEQMTKEIKNLSDEELVSVLKDSSQISETLKSVLGKFEQELLSRLNKKSTPIAVKQETIKQNHNVVSIPLFDVENIKKSKVSPQEIPEIMYLIYQGEKIEQISIAYNVTTQSILKIKANFPKSVAQNYQKQIDKKEVVLIHSVKKLSYEQRMHIADLLSKSVSEKIIATKYHLPLLSVALMKSYQEGRRMPYRKKQMA